jgi:hypothetical protein
MRLKIISDGTVFGTRVETEDGQLLEHMVEVRWQHTAGRIPRAHLCVLDAQVEVEGELKAMLLQPGPVLRKTAKAAALQEELEVTDRLLEERNQVMEAIPACPAHGNQCVPHALDWIEWQKERGGQ